MIILHFQLQVCYQSVEHWSSVFERTLIFAWVCFWKAIQRSGREIAFFTCSDYVEYEAQNNQSLLVQTGYTTNSLLQAVVQSRFSLLTIFSCCIGLPAHFACGRSEFLQKKNILINVYQTPTNENNKLINWKFVSSNDSFSSSCGGHRYGVVFGLCVNMVYHG